MSTSRQFIRFLFVGALNAAFGYCVFAGLILAGLGSIPALVLAYVLGVPFNFMTTRRMVFRAAGGMAAFLRFVAAYVLIYLFNLALLEGVIAAGAKALLAQALVLPVVALFSFLLFKFQVFRKPA